MSDFGHVMVDIETTGKDPGAAILSISAVEFNLGTGDIGKEFYKNIDLRSCIDSGLEIDPDTFLWWLQQSDKARSSITEGQDGAEHLKEVLISLTAFIISCGEDVEVWGNSNRFDLGIIHHAYKVLGHDIPWKFWLERDVRTLVSLNPSFKINEPFTGIPHYAPDDSKHQIKYCHKTLVSLKK